MALASDERATQRALSDLATGQPAAPADRMAAVRRRHARRRTAQVTAATVAVVAVLLGAFVTVGSLGSGAGRRVAPAEPPAVAGWQLPWPDRHPAATAADRSWVEQVRQQAVSSFRSQYGGGPLRQVHYLYTGTPAGGHVLWVVLEAAWGRPDAGHQLIARASADGGQTWTTYLVPAPARDTPLLPFGRPADRRLFVLGAPDVAAAGLVDLSSGVTVHSAHPTPLSDGVAVLRVRHPLRPETLYVGEPDYRSPYPVLLPGYRDIAKGTPAWEAEPGVTPGVTELDWMSANGSGTRATLHMSDHGHLYVTVRCAGPAPAVVTVSSGPHRTVLPQHRCDGVLGHTTGFAVHPGQKVVMTVDAPDPTRYVARLFLTKP